MPGLPQLCRVLGENRAGTVEPLLWTTSSPFPPAFGERRYKTSKCLRDAPKWQKKADALSPFHSLCVFSTLQSYLAPTEEERERFLLNVWNEPTYLEDVTGLSELKSRVEAAMEAMDFDEEGEGGSDNGGGGDDDDDFQLL